MVQVVVQVIGKQVVNTPRTLKQALVRIYQSISRISIRLTCLYFVMEVLVLGVSPFSLLPQLPQKLCMLQKWSEVT